MARAAPRRAASIMARQRVGLRRNDGPRIRILPLSSETKGRLFEGVHIFHTVAINTRVSDQPVPTLGFAHVITHLANMYRS
jgi:hypothetical protein